MELAVHQPGLSDAALLALRVGLCVLPARTDQKRPAVPSWKTYQQRLPTESEVGAWFANRPAAMCVVCGAVSGHLEMIDFDHGAELFDAWLALVAERDPDLAEKVFLEQSPSGGRHVAYRCEEPVCGNLKLAQRRVVCPSAEPLVIAGKTYKPRREADGTWSVVITLIETRGEGGLFLCAPSPGYQVIRGDLAELPVLTNCERDILLESAWSLTEHVADVVDAPAAPAGRRDRIRPGDDYARRSDVGAILRRHGWTLFRPGENEHWCRPGKTAGTSATLRDGLFFVFSSNAAPFEPNKAYTPFAVYAHLEHNGDFGRAAAALRAEGFGSDPDADVDLAGLMPAATVPDEATPLSCPDPLPDEFLSVPGFIADVMAFNLATAVRPQPVLALAAALCLQAVLAARKVCDQRGNRTNIYAIGIADSGRGKDHGRKVNRQILFHAGLDVLEGNEDLASDAGLVAAVEQQPGVLFQIDEFGRFLRTIGDPKKAPHLFNVVGTLMKLYSSADTVFRGKAYADPKRNKVIDQPCVSLYATSVPDHFFESLTSEGLADGFIARLSAFEAHDAPARQRVPFTAPPPEIIEAARWWGDFQPGGNMRSEHPQPLVIAATAEAEEIFDEFATTVDRELSLTGAEVRSLWARAEEKACRFALIYACSANREHPVIDGPAARWACGLSTWLTRRMLALAGQWVSDGLFDARQKKVLRIIRAAGGAVARSDLCRKTQSLSVRERSEIIENLKATGQLEEHSTGGGPGRPKVMYALR